MKSSYCSIQDTMKGTTALLLLAVALVASATAKQLPQPESPIAPAAAIQDIDQDQALPSDLTLNEAEDEELVVVREKILLRPNGCPWNPHIVWFIPDKWNCRGYYHCDNGRKVHMKCPAKLHWNRRLNTCDWPEKAGCQSFGYSEAVAGADAAWE